jgi:hypothetical protein
MELNNVIIYGILFVIDMAGFIIKCSVNERFSKYHLRNMPFIWVVFS